MAKNHSKQTRAQSQEQTKTIKELGNAINCMDALSQEGFSEIEAIAKLALLSLESPEGYRHLDNIAFALRSISTKASMTQDSINSEAEEMGFNYRDDDPYRRWDAASTFKNSERTI